MQGYQWRLFVGSYTVHWPALCSGRKFAIISSFFSLVDGFSHKKMGLSIGVIDFFLFILYIQLSILFFVYTLSQQILLSGWSFVSIVRYQCTFILFAKLYKLYLIVLLEKYHSLAI